MTGTTATTSEQQHKSSVLGASSNLVNAIVGAGIVGIPFALRETGLIAGVVLVGMCAILAEKSLRMLVETAHHVNASTYETLTEAAFGSFGFTFVLISMFSLAYGSMVTYLMIVKDTLPRLMGILPDDTFHQQVILVVVSLLVIVPLSSQKDMADLSKTSRVNVMFDLIMVCCVVWVAPIEENVQGAGGFAALLQQSTIHPSTLYVGLGVLSFAFVCQHSAFIISGSLEQPRQWGRVTKLSLGLCGCLATLCGMGGYLGFLENTQGNILNNLGDGLIPNLARGLLGTTMLFVYPMESFVARHVCVVLIKRFGSMDVNSNRQRIALIFTLYIMALVPALLFTDLGKVLAVTGTVGGSCLSYIGPGAAYLGVHGEAFQKLVVKRYWTLYYLEDDGASDSSEDDHEHGIKDERMLFAKTILWYVLCMPVWYRIANIGRTHVAARQLQNGGTISMVKLNKTTAQESNSDEDFAPLVNGANGEEMLSNENDLPTKTDFPTVRDFFVAIGYILFGVVALSAGVISIFMEKSGPAP